MHSFQVTLFALLALTGLAAGAAAQSLGGTTSDRLVSFGVGGGVSVPVNDAGDAFKSGFVGHAFARLNLHQLPIAPRVEVAFSRWDLKDARVSSGGSGSMLAGLAALQVYLLHGPVRPYVVAGLGAYDVKANVNATAGVPASSASSTHFGVNGGAGVLVHLGGVLSGFVEGRLDNVYTPSGFIDTKQVQLIPVSFGLVF